MKKYNLLKVLAITIFVTWLLTLIIPGSYLDYYGNVTKGDIAGVGIWTLLSNLSISISYFNGIAVFVLAIAVFYAVLNKVEVYNTFVSKVAEIFKDKRKALIVITTIVFGVLSAVISDSLILLVFLPFIYKVMSEISIDKKTILASTIIAGLLGSMCNVYNSALYSSFNLEINTLLLVKVLLLVITLFVLIMFIAPKKNKEVKAEKSTKKEATKVVAKTAKKTVTKVTIKKAEPKKPATKKATAKPAAKKGKKVA